jgi:putative endonuclease
VKFRSGPLSGNSLAAVGRNKQRIISKVANFYLLTHFHSLEIPCRFDVIGIDGDEISWIKNAFDYLP